MRAIMLITDSEVMPEFERVLLAEGHQGFTVVPAAGLLAVLRRVRDDGGYGERTRRWSFAVEEAD